MCSDEIVSSLESLLANLDEIRAQATTMLVEERRAKKKAPRKDVVVALAMVQRNLASVREALGGIALAAPPSPEEAKERKLDQPVVSLKRDRPVVAIVSTQEEEEEEEDVSRELKKLAKPVKKQRVAPVGDGMACRLKDNDASTHLVYFALVHGRDKKKNFSCPTNNANGTVLVKRCDLIEVAFDLMQDVDERAWYLGQVEADVVKRFSINFPVLFASKGRDMVTARCALVENPATATMSILDDLVKHAQALQLADKTSPSLSGANNIALMLAAAIHAKLLASGEAGWHNTFREHVEKISATCTLSPKTMERYVNARKLMLRSSLISCLLPSFVFELKGPITALLDDPNMFARLEAVFESSISTFAARMNLAAVVGPKTKERRQFELHRDGFQVYPSWFVMDAKIVNLLLLHSSTRTEIIFNNGKVDDDENDQLRRQIFFRDFEAVDKELPKVRISISVKLDSMFAKHRSQDMVVLRSEPGCSAQRSHTDYLPEDVGDLPDELMPLGCVVACMDKTFFDVWPGAIRCFEPPTVVGKAFEHVRLELNTGDMVLFRGDLVHAGASFDALNVRIHTYLDVRRAKRSQNTTNFVDAEEGRVDILPRK